MLKAILYGITQWIKRQEAALQDSQVEDVQDVQKRPVHTNHTHYSYDEDYLTDLFEMPGRASTTEIKGQKTKGKGKKESKARKETGKPVSSHKKTG